MSEEKNNELEMLEEYDFSKASIGNYANQYAEGTNVVVLDPDIAKRFRDSAAVNQALRRLPTKNASHHAVYRLWKDNTGQWAWSLVAADNRIIATSSERYSSKADCLEAIEIVKSSVEAPVKVA